MIPIFNSQGQHEFNLVLGRKFLRCFFEILKALKTGASSIEIHRKDSAKYPQLVKFIAKVFNRHYGANIQVSAPKIMTVIDHNNKSVSALAIRCAAGEKLFLEQYLDQDIEVILSKKFGIKVKRQEIVEIGSLASSKKYAARLLYISLAAYLKARGYKYVVATGTDYLFDSFKKVKMRPQILAQALKSRLSDQEDHWGSYYDSNPQVMVLDIEHSYRVLGGLLGVVAVPCLDKLYPKLSYQIC